MNRSPADVVALLSNEVRLTTAYLHIHPKVYWIWNHRKWCLENVPLGPGDPSEEVDVTRTGGEEGWRNEFWKVELRMLEAMLGADARNCEDFPRLLSHSYDVQGEMQGTKRQGRWAWRSVKVRGLLVTDTISSCLGLPTLRPPLTTCHLHASADRYHRNALYPTEDRG